jgi:hypothetical protein
MNSKIQLPEQTLFNDLSQLIEQSNNFVIVQANSVMTMTNFDQYIKQVEPDKKEKERQSVCSRLTA